MRCFEITEFEKPEFLNLRFCKIYFFLKDFSIRALQKCFLNKTKTVLDINEHAKSGKA